MGRVLPWSQGAVRGADPQHPEAVGRAQESKASRVQRPPEGGLDASWSLQDPAPSIPPARATLTYPAGAQGAGALFVGAPPLRGPTLRPSWRGADKGFRMALLP